MNEHQRALCEKLRAMESKDAASWLIDTYPIEGNYGEALVLIPHRSWSRPDQLRLARHFLQLIPFANDHGYRAFASFMRISAFLQVIEERVPFIQPERLDLLRYYLAPLLKQCSRSTSDKQATVRFLADLEKRIEQHAGA